MRKLIFSLSLLLLASGSLFADKKDVPLTPITPADGQTLVPNSPRGRRTPTRNIQCTVDIDQKTITISSDAVVISYELWNLEGDTLLYESTSDYDTVEFMTTVQGEYQLRLVAEECSYLGYINL